MKRLFLPIALLSFAVICLSIVHLENINKLNKESNELREKQIKLNQNNSIESEDYKISRKERAANSPILDQ